MEIVLLIGSLLRASVLPHLVKQGIRIKCVIVPFGEKYHSLLEATKNQTAINVRPVKRAYLLEVLREIEAKTIVCVGWTYLFEPAIVEGPWLLLNSHPTLLPKYRGPNPWYHIIAESQDRAGITVHKIDNGMDKGPILHQVIVPLTPFDTYSSLRSKLIEAEPCTIYDSLIKLSSGNPSFTPQDETQASTFPKVRTPEDSEIDSSRPLIDLVDSIRACDPDAFPAFFYYHGQKVCIKLWRSQRSDDDHSELL